MSLLCKMRGSRMRICTLESRTEHLGNAALTEEIQFFGTDEAGLIEARRGGRIPQYTLGFLEFLCCKEARLTSTDL